MSDQNTTVPAAAATAPAPTAIDGTRVVVPPPFKLDDYRPRQVPVLVPALSQVPIRRPFSSEIVRAFPSPDCPLQVPTLTIRQTNQTYLVSSEVFEKLREEPTAGLSIVAPMITRESSIILALASANPRGNSMDWSRSFYEGVTRAKTEWVRLVANFEAERYDCLPVTVKLPEPKWREMTLEGIIQAAFADRVISDINHPVLRRLRGEI